MKTLFVTVFIGIFISSCGDDEAKIDALEEKLYQQEQAIQAEKQADLEKELAEKNAELERLKNEGASKTLSQQTFYARGFGDYPEASERRLTYDDVSGLNKFELKIMRNEIFARYGYIFKTQDMKNHFSTKRWYQPLYKDVNNRLTSLEKENAEYIKNFE
jgi:uncharacterized coiled-coil protein SlyX